MTNTPETIYLIPGEDRLIWCNDPTPDEYCDPADAVKYVRADVHQAIIDRQAKLAISGMDAAKRHAISAEDNAKRLLAASNPEALESERAMNAALTEENERLCARVAELEAMVPPQERGANRYGLDMAYFRNLFNRELNRPLVDFTPSELARVLARAARTADPAVLQEPEFQPVRAQCDAEPVGFHEALWRAKKVFREYRDEFPKWGKRLDGTPAANDLPVQVAKAFSGLYTRPPNAGVPEGWVLMPEELTAENGAKYLLVGEFEEVVDLECGACDSDDEGCEVCSGHGSYTYRVPVSWSTIKSIYKLAVDNLQRPQPQKQEGK